MTTSLAFDHSHCFLAIANCNNSLSIRKFSSTNDSISDDYLFTIECITTEFLDPTAWLNQKAVLSWDTSTNNNYRHGLITHAAYLGKMLDGYHYQLNLSSLLYPLKLRSNNRVYLNKTITEIFTDVLQKAAISHFRLQFPNWPDSQRYIVQYQQSDWDFLMMLMARFGINFIWQQQQNNANLIFVDDLTALNSLYPAAAIELIELQHTANLLPQSVALDDYNPTTPQTSLKTGNGDWEIYAEHYFTLQEGQQLAAVKQNQIDTARFALIALTNERDLQPGQLITVGNQSYRINTIEHLCENHNAHYQAKLYSILPTQKITKTNPLDNKQKLTRGILSTKIQRIDENGNYVVDLPFDGETPPLRLMQPHGGNIKNQTGYGMHFPVRANTEMATVSLYGDISRPILLGTMANPDTPTTVTADNHTQSFIRSFSGNELCMEDQAAQEKIWLNTPQQQNALLLDATQDNHQVTLQSLDGQINMYANKNLNITSQQQHLHQIGDIEEIKVKNNQEVHSQQNMALQSGQDLALTAKQNVVLKTQQQNLTASSAQQITIQAKNNFIAQGNTVVIHTNGDTTLYAANQINLAGSQGAQLQQGGNSIAMQGGNLSFNTSTLQVNASAINMPQPTGAAAVSPNGDIDQQLSDTHTQALNLVNHQLAQHAPSDDDEFKLFVATVYGESSGSSEAAWKAVASVIINRVNTYHYGHSSKIAKSITEVIKQTGFDAYTQKNAEFTQATAFMNSHAGWITNPTNDDTAPRKLYKLREAIGPIYSNNQATTSATDYFSPRSQNKLHLRKPNEYSRGANKIRGNYLSHGYHRVNVPGLLPTDDFEFYAK